jgi:hypothetical protein
VSDDLENRIPVDQVANDGKSIEAGLVYGAEPDRIFLRFRQGDQVDFSVLLRVDEALLVSQMLIAAALAVEA